MTTVTQLVLREGSLALERHDERALKPHEVRVRVAYVGICGSELHLLHDPEWLTGVHVLGHEWSGVVEELGTGVTTLQLGQHVACKPCGPCMRCRACYAGRTGDCAAMEGGELGAWAETNPVDARFAIPVPEGVSLREAALAEPLAACLRAVEKAAMAPGHTALVIGGGPIGLLLALLVGRCGAHQVVVMEPGAYRRALASELGFATIDPQACAAAERARELTGGLGFDVVYEAVGSQATVELAIACAGRGATIVVVGVAPKGDVVGVRPYEIFSRELRIIGAAGIEPTLPRALDWLPVLGAERIVTHELPLERGVEAVELAASGDCGKVLIVPGAGE